MAWNSNDESPALAALVVGMATRLLARHALAIVNKDIPRLFSAWTTFNE